MQFTKLTTLFALAALFCSALAVPHPRPGAPHEEHHGHNIDENNHENSSVDNFENTELDHNTASKDSVNAGMCSGDSKTYCCNTEKSTTPSKGGISFINEITSGSMQCSQMPISMPSSMGIGGALSMQDTNQDTCKNEVYCCTGDRTTQNGIFNVNMGAMKCNKSLMK